ncbi:MAG: transposase [Dehalococcoidia bacterium]
MPPEHHIDLLAYFITFRCYGTWLHGDQRGSVDDSHNIPGTEMLPPDLPRERSERSKLAHEPQSLDLARRMVVDATIREGCQFRGWLLTAINVRSNHVHVVVTADGIAPEEVMRVMKARATRCLREAGLLTTGERLWSEHGSTIYLWTERQVASAIWYVTEGQGRPNVR